MISLIVPVLDEGEALRSHLPLWQELRHLREIVVVDGGSSDASAQVAAGHGARVLVSARGRGPQLNAGAAAAEGEVLLFLHADCWLQPAAGDEVVELLQRRSVAAGAFRQRIEARGLAYRMIEAAAALRSALLMRPYGDSGLFLRRETFERAGGFPPIPLCEDLAFARKLAALGRIVLADSRVHLSSRRWRQRGILKTTLKNHAIAWSYRLGVSPARLYRAYYGRNPETS